MPPKQNPPTASRSASNDSNAGARAFGIESSGPCGHSRDAPSATCPGFDSAKKAPVEALHRPPAASIRSPPGTPHTLNSTLQPRRIANSHLQDGATQSAVAGKIAPSQQHLLARAGLLQTPRNSNPSSRFRTSGERRPVQGMTFIRNCRFSFTSWVDSVVTLLLTNGENAVQTMPEGEIPAGSRGRQGLTSGFTLHLGTPRCGAG